MAKFQTKTFNDVTPLVLPTDAKPTWISVPIEFKATAYAAADLIEACKLPIGLRVLDWALSFPDIDSGAAGLAWSLGTENAALDDISAEVWGSALTAGQSTAIVRNTTSVASQGDITKDRTVVLKCTTIAGTYAGAGKVGHLLLLAQS